jgi:peptide/nickel transport system substrate-binding protein
LRLVTRRAALAGGLALGGAALFRPGIARALGRTPLGGRVAFHVPWSVSSIDPHDLGDPAAALFSTAIADPVFALDGAGNAYPSLVQAAPARDAGETIVKLREGLHTARGVPLDARDLVSSVERARARGAAAWLVDVPRPSTRRDDPHVAVFGGVDAMTLMRALSSPLVALLPRRFSPSQPDGTGAFRADISGGVLRLTRNVNAARGNAFLDEIDVSPAEDLRTSLREFEAERDDLGWLGTGLHDVRRGAVKFDLGRAALVALVTSGDAGAFGMPGVAQRLASAIPPERIAHLGLGALPPAVGDAGWGGPPVDLLVDAGAPHLVEIARTVAPILARTGHEVTAAPVPRAEIAKRKARGGAVLSIELVRTFSSLPSGVMPALAALEDAGRAADLARHPLRLPGNTPPRALTSTLRVGVLGDLRVTGGAMPDLALAHATFGDGWDLGATFKRKK